MHVWIIQDGEVILGIDPGAQNWRCGMLARALVARGHTVLWWTSTFNHYAKAQRFAESRTIETTPGLNIRLLHGPGYRKNKSFKRWLHNIVIARAFAYEAKTAQKPDIICASLPTLELAEHAALYGEKNKTPVVIDAQDLWPDIIADLAPGFLKFIARFFLLSLFRKAAFACRHATAIIGITPPFVQWALKYAGRNAGPLDRDFPLAYSDAPPPETDLKEARSFWDNLGITEANRLFTICFFGYFRAQFDFDTISKALAQIPSSGPWRFVLCGNSDSPSLLRNLQTTSRFILPGWVNQAQIWTLMERSSMGLAPYRNTRDFMASIPTKFIEYLAAGLPVLSSLHGYSRQILQSADCGIFYENGDPMSLFNALGRVEAEPALLNAMSQRARNLFIKNFKAETVYNNMAQCLEETVEKQHTRVRDT